MKILLQHTGSGLFYKSLGIWVADENDARVFVSALDAIEFWSVCSVNGLALSQEQMAQFERYVDDLLYWNEKVNLISRRRIEADAARARRLGAELVIANLHWGEEYVHAPSDKQRELARDHRAGAGA